MLATAVDRVQAFAFRPAADRERAAVSTFLARTLRLASGHALLDERHLRWKYFSPRPDWTGSRSFIACRDGAIAAHIAVWPVRIRLPGHAVVAVHGIDWAADPACPGAGIRLVRWIGGRIGLMLATGGTEMAQRILPVIGFRQHGEIYRCARPIRPLGQALTTTPRTWKLPARLLRNTVWKVLPPLSVPREWSAAPLLPEDVPARLWPQPSASVAVTARDAGVYRYFLDSPSHRHLLFGLEKGGELCGYFCLAFAPHVAHIADLWVVSGQVEDWSAAFRMAALVAARDRDVYEVTAWASTAAGKEGLLRAGFHVRERTPVSLGGDAAFLNGHELHIQMIDCDESVLSDEAVSYLT